MLTQSTLEKLYLDESFIYQKIETAFDIDLLNRVHEQNTKHISPKQKDQNPNYDGYCIQSDIQSDPFFGCLHQTRVHDENQNYVQVSDFHFHKEKNEFGERFASIFEKFPFSLYQGRVLIAKPNCKIVRHNDGRFRLTLHVPLATNSGCQFEVNGEHFHLPADGSSYLLNTRMQHSFSNEGSTNRIHLIFAIWPICIQNPGPEFKAKYAGFYEKASAFKY